MPDAPIIMPACVVDCGQVKPVTRLALGMTQHSAYRSAMSLHFYTDGSYTPASAQVQYRCSWATVLLGEFPKAVFHVLGCAAGIIGMEQAHNMGADHLSNNAGELTALLMAFACARQLCDARAPCSAASVT
eukprot:12691101-Alexandrium_andersonii.AAC.1